MIGSKFICSDNSGAKIVQTIRVIPSIKVKMGIGCLLLVSIKQVKNREKIEKGTLHRAIILSLKRLQHRKDGSSFSFNSNTVALLNSTNQQPLGTRILGCVPYEVRKNGCMKLLSLGTSTL